MRILADGMEMRGMDRHSIETIGIPSLVLMERAAWSVVQEMKGRLAGRPSILIVSSTGNNGADGLAMARMLSQEGFPAEILIVGDPERATEEWKQQRHICEKLGLVIRHEMLTAEYIRNNQISVLVDALLGTGLSRLVTGVMEQTIHAINQSEAYVVSVDIPSGISADSGAVLGIAVRADLTVTFQCEKLGMVLYPGREYCGETVIRDIGILQESQESVHPRAYTMEKEDLENLPERPAYSNKGTFGKVLVIAGSKNMAGAAYLSGLAAYRTGAGLVRIYTPEENRIILQTLLPEAILTTYEAGYCDVKQLQELCGWADSVVMGPGFGVSETSGSILHYMLQYCAVPMVLDADALNLIAQHTHMTDVLRPGLILTPHLGEMSRLMGIPVSHMMMDLPRTARTFSKRYGIILVLKDACTLVADGSERLYVNTCGNSGMATGGSGDVLSGIIGGLLAAGELEPFEAAAYGVLLHGTAGDQAAAETGERSLMASDLVRRIP